ncbi:hypothetical protein [Aureimonas psammosilenae]|uniref:hypothetical protein n=1 Tax=Aureimonas psammosilenae TaxID=2495496 RepID=UPI001260AAA7|nr:hypothetical protein [Aureimonas psammosilenae]
MDECIFELMDLGNQTVLEADLVETLQLVSAMIIDLPAIVAGEPVRPNLSDYDKSKIRMILQEALKRSSKVTFDRLMQQQGVIPPKDAGSLN